MLSVADPEPLVKKNYTYLGSRSYSECGTSVLDTELHLFYLLYQDLYQFEGSRQLIMLGFRS